MAQYSRRFEILQSSGSSYEPSGAYTYGIYDVETTSEATNVIRAADYYGNDFLMSDVLQMWVDGVEVTPSQTYQFATTGRHVVEFNIPTISSLAGMWYGCDRLVEVYYQNSTFTASNGYQCYRVFAGCDSLLKADFTNCNLSALTEVRELFGGGAPMFDMRNLVGFGNQLGNCTAQQDLISGAYNTQYRENPLSEMVLNGWVFGPGPSTYDGINYADAEIFAYCCLEGTLDLRTCDLSNILLLNMMFVGSIQGAYGGIDKLYMGGPLNPNVTVYTDQWGSIWGKQSSSYFQWWLNWKGTFYYDGNYYDDYAKILEYLPDNWTAEPWN